MKRRQFVRAAAASALMGGIARPAIVRAASATTLKFVPYADLALLDPLVSAFVTRNHVMMVFDTLFASTRRATRSTRCSPATPSMRIRRPGR